MLGKRDSESHSAEKSALGDAEVWRRHIHRTADDLQGLGCRFEVSLTHLSWRDPTKNLGAADAGLNSLFLAPEGGEAVGKGTGKSCCVLPAKLHLSGVQLWIKFKWDLKELERPRGGPPARSWILCARGCPTVGRDLLLFLVTPGRARQKSEAAA